MERRRRARARVPHPFLRHEWVRTWWDASAAGHAPLHPGRPRQRPRDGHRAAHARDGGDVRDSRAARALPPQRPHAADRRDRRRTTRRPRTGQSGARSGRIASAGTCCCSASSNADSTTQQAFREFAAAERLRTGTWRSSDSPYLPLTGTWDAYLASAAGEVPLEPPQPAVAPDEDRAGLVSKS